LGIPNPPLYFFRQLNKILAQVGLSEKDGFHHLISGLYTIKAREVLSISPKLLLFNQVMFSTIGWTMDWYQPFTHSHTFFDGEDLG
jgi:hypothetical protein